MKKRDQIAALEYELNVARDVLGKRIKALVEEVKELRGALESKAIQEVKQSDQNRTPVTYWVNSCSICYAWWEIGEKGRHKEDCPLNEYKRVFA